MENTKICSRCKKERPIFMFGINRSTKDQKNSSCKNCRNSIRRFNYNSDRDSSEVEKLPFDLVNQIKLKKFINKFENIVVGKDIEGNKVRAEFKKCITMIDDVDPDESVVIEFYSSNELKDSFQVDGNEEALEVIQSYFKTNHIRILIDLPVLIRSS